MIPSIGKKGYDTLAKLVNDQQALTEKIQKEAREKKAASVKVK